MLPAVRFAPVDDFPDVESTHVRVTDSR
jgi:hypothetical protein